MEEKTEDMNFDFIVPALSTKSLNSGTGTVRKNKKMLYETDEQIETPLPENETSSKSSNHKSIHLNEEEKTPPISNEPNINLSKDELLKLLSVFEGELQARDEVISILKTQCSKNSDSRYGFTSQPLKALQRDAATLEVTSQDLVCEQTKEQLQKIIQHQKDSYRKLKQMHLASEEKYQRLSADMEEEKQKHQEYILKSDDFVNLLEHDRDRIKHIHEKEKAVHERKERDLMQKVKDNMEELTRVKSLSLELVEERQQQLQIINEQKHLAFTLQQRVDDLELKVKEAEKTAETEKEQSAQLENELEDQTNKFFKDYEILNVKLTTELAKSKDQEEKIKSLGRQMRKLKCVDKNLRKTDDQLWRIKEKLGQEERYDDLLEEVELLRKTVVGMQEAEKIYMQAQGESKELRDMMEKELALTAAVREEFENLRNSIRNKTDTERCVEEGMFRLEEVQQQFEAERKKVKKMNKQIEEFRERLTKMDETEKLLQMSEITLEQLYTVAQEKKQAEEDLKTKLQLEREKSDQYKEMIEDEKNKVTDVTQKMVEESKKVLKLKEKLATLETKRIEETGLLRCKLESAGESIKNMITKEKAVQMEALITNLRKQIAMLKKRLDQLENERVGNESKARIAKEKSEKLKGNVGKSTTKVEYENAIKKNKSTEKLTRLVGQGLNEELTAGYCEEIQLKYSNLKITNASLQKELELLQSKLQESASNKMTKNNNNIALKGVSVCHTASQTVNPGDKSPTSRRSHTPVRRHSSLSTISSDSKSSNIRRASSSSRRDLSIGRSSHGTVARSQLKTTATCPRKFPTAPSANRMVNGPTSSDADESSKTLLVRLNSNEDRNTSCQSPASMTVTHDPSEETIPTFRIVKTKKTGDQHFETSVTDNKKNIQRRTSSKSLVSSSPQSRPPSTSSATGRSMKSKGVGKATPKASVTPTHHSRSKSKTKKSDTVERRASISPTRIPKYCNSTSAPTSPAVRRVSRSGPTT